MSGELQVTIGDKGFPVFVHHDINDLDVTQVRELKALIEQYVVVVFREQHLTADDQLEVCNRFGECTNTRNLTKLIRDCDLDNDYVTKFVGNRELDWHADAVNTLDRKPFLWVYSAKDTKGSVTSWANTALSLKEMPVHWRSRLENKKIYFDFGQNREPDNEPEFDLIVKNDYGVSGIYYPLVQVPKIRDISSEEQKEISDFLSDYLLQERFVYHHHWEDGDVVLCDQWLSMHKKWLRDSELPGRIVNRIMFNYSKI